MFKDVFANYGVLLINGRLDQFYSLHMIYNINKINYFFRTRFLQEPHITSLKMIISFIFPLKVAVNDHSALKWVSPG